ncbi:MAG: hypothetical protein VXX82_03240 [Verrucomicrobiota bacterium]|nr:hypothetical protein [Verrucomicrobiota bacterium]
MPLLKLPNSIANASTNMAIDAALLKTVPATVALFRHYAWSEPTITFGYTQKWEQVHTQFLSSLIFCRRITAGGIVDHRNDWTYSLILGNSLDAFLEKSSVVYFTLHNCILAELTKQKVQGVLASCPRHCSDTEIPQIAICFQQVVANDVIAKNGQKIAGAAIKRSRQGLLVQGSIDRQTLPNDFDFNIFSQGLVDELSHALDIPVGHSDDLRGLFNITLIEQERVRFESTGWLKRR